MRIDRGEISLDGLEGMVQRLTAQAFADRAQRLGTYLGEKAIDGEPAGRHGDDREEGAGEQLRGVSRGAFAGSYSA